METRCYLFPSEKAMKPVIEEFRRKARALHIERLRAGENGLGAVLLVEFGEGATHFRKSFVGLACTKQGGRTLFLRSVAVRPEGRQALLPGF